jgi:hypothetical protein
MAELVALLLVIWEVLDSYLGMETPWQTFFGSTQCFQGKAGRVPQIIPQLLSSISFLIHYASIILQLDNI